jgi:lipid-A-disaccharide synthase
MIPTRFMVIAGEASGDELAAELVKELRAGVERRAHTSKDAQPINNSLAPRFFGAGGKRMADAGVELAFDLTQHSVIGLDLLHKYFQFRELFNRLLALALEREPHVIICVDFSVFNSMFAAAIKKHVRARRGTFNNWEPRVIKYISPQVWASRAGRAYQIARDFDLLLSIFPFEKKWYASRVPSLPVEFVGHPLLDRYASAQSFENKTDAQTVSIVLLPGSRRRELERHLPVMLETFARIRAAMPSATAKIVLPDADLSDLARAMIPSSASVQIQIGELSTALRGATIAISKTGTITMECACFGVPTVTLYKTSWATYEIGKRLVKVKSLTMPNLLADEPVFPEFIQNDATPEKISAAALELLRNPSARQRVRARLTEIIMSLGGPGASRRAADAILNIMP